ncbi:NADP-dependent oxidoreductase [Micromonospora sp. NPDC050397]|uniref:NADP-dependent oxidoreductase n=1 Tax=Micromonospora sp. NPDC050397 TaxID=3364279 RepID=UPI00384AACFD
MRVATQDRFGGPEVLTIVERDRPTPRPGEVLVRVKAASVNYGEGKLRAGTLPEAGQPPFTLGSDLSGVVAETGPGVTRFRPGDEVYGIYFIGTYAEYVRVPASNLATKPSTLDHTHAAALPVAALTAAQAIFELAKAHEGQRILVHAAAGGVGHFAVQFAKSQGAYVAATARAEKHEFLRGLGVDQPIDYSTVDFTTVAREMDVVLDLVGGEYGPRSLDVLRPGGLLLGAALPPGVDEAQAAARDRRYSWVGVRASGAELEKITDLVQAGQILIHVQRTYPLDELVEAHRVSETGRVTGKLVITL